MSRTFVAVALAVMFPMSGESTGDRQGPPTDLDAFFEEDAVEVGLAREVPGSERSNQPDSIADEPPWVRPDQGAGGNQTSEGGSSAVIPPPPNRSSSLYCSTASGSLNQSCQSLINALPTSLGCLVGAGAVGSNTPICLDETPEPVVDEAVVEAAVEVPADEGPDIAEILEQIPGLVAEEFATLPIDGGSVEFEEELLGFGYINRHTNVFAEVEQQTFEQNMLGIDVEIRAVPVDYHFDYGDGTTHTTADPGQPATGGDAAITDLETPTSHVYQDTGLYDVAVSTTFTGEYRISGGGWTPIADSAAISASPGEADIWRIQSRHVSGQCEASSQWGCNGPFTLEGDDRPPRIFADQYDDAGNWRGP